MADVNPKVCFLPDPRVNFQIQILPGSDALGKIDPALHLCCLVLLAPVLGAPCSFDLCLDARCLLPLPRCLLPLPTHAWGLLCRVVSVAISKPGCWMDYQYFCYLTTLFFFFFWLDGAQFTVWGWFAKRATQLCSRSCVKDGVTFLRQVRGMSVVRPGWEGKSYFLQYFCLVFLLTSHFNLEFLLAFSWRIVFVHHFRT